ncbi:MAG: FadR/GntR family transcriptional regulator [Pseudorhodoplanes sp.]
MASQQKSSSRHQRVSAPPAGQGRRGQARLAADAIRAEIERQIVEGLLKPGERLATERELATQFGTSRAVARTAVMSMVRAGKVSRHVGRGSFVLDSNPHDAAKPALFPDLAPAEIMEFRCLLEPSLIDLIMLNANNAEIDAIAACVAEGDAATDRAQWNLCDDKFHRLLASATHNRLVIALYEAFSAARQSAAWTRLKQKAVNQNLWQTFQAQHKLIAQALVNGDRDRAVQATREHVMHARAIMMGYSPSAFDLAAE